METELQVEMTRYTKLTEDWTGFHKYKILCAWMGTARMKEMNDFLTCQMAEQAKQHAEPSGPRTAI